MAAEASAVAEVLAAEEALAAVSAEEASAEAALVGVGKSNLVNPFPQQIQKPVLPNTDDANI